MDLGRVCLLERSCCAWFRQGSSGTLGHPDIRAKAHQHRPGRVHSDHGRNRHAVPQRFHGCAAQTQRSAAGKNGFDAMWNIESGVRIREPRSPRGASVPRRSLKFSESSGAMAYSESVTGNGIATWDNEKISGGKSMSSGLVRVCTSTRVDAALDGMRRVWRGVANHRHAIVLWTGTHQPRIAFEFS